MNARPISAPGTHPQFSYINNHKSSLLSHRAVENTTSVADVRSESQSGREVVFRCRIHLSIFITVQPDRVREYNRKPVSCWPHAGSISWGCDGTCGACSSVNCLRVYVRLTGTRLNNHCNPPMCRCRCESFSCRRKRYDVRVGLRIALSHELT